MNLPQKIFALIVGSCFILGLVAAGDCKASTVRCFMYGYSEIWTNVDVTAYETIYCLDEDCTTKVPIANCIVQPDGQQTKEDKQ